jgi:hypothetical protein
MQRLPVPRIAVEAVHIGALQYPVETNARAGLKCQVSGCHGHHISDGDACRLVQVMLQPGRDRQVPVLAVLQ